MALAPLGAYSRLIKFTAIFLTVPLAVATGRHISVDVVESDALGPWPVTFLAAGALLLGHLANDLDHGGLHVGSGASNSLVHSLTSVLGR